LPTGCQPESLAKPARRRFARGNPAAAAYAPRELDDHSFGPEEIAIARYRQRRVVASSCEIFATLDKSFHSVHIADQISCSAVTKLQQRRKLKAIFLTPSSRLVLLSQKVATNDEENHLFGKIHTSAMGGWNGSAKIE
jgi:hypothetical protein